MRVTLQQVSGQHPAARSGAAPAVRELSLRVAAGEQVAIIGPSGAGKTTALHLLACALKPSSGQVLLDDQDPWQLSRSALQTLRGALFLAPQVPPLPPRQRVVTAVLAGRLPHQGLWASVRSLFYPTDIALAERALARFGLADKLFERVDRLSGGERQRVAIARAFLRNAPILILEEATSSLDSESEGYIQDALRRLMQGRTTIVIAHRLSTIRNMDRIVVMEEGKISEDGTHDQLINAGGKYSLLWSLQQGGFLQDEEVLET